MRDWARRRLREESSLKGLTISDLVNYGAYRHPLSLNSLIL